MKGAWVCLVALLTAAGAGATGGGCSSPPASNVPRAELLQPKTCAPCHESHFNDWSVSMHAQAADDPVFIAMNKRGQRETGGKLGTFCVQCHAPMAVRDGLTTDGLNLASLPTYYKGVTCFFCHSIDSVGTSHSNASVNLATDLAMRGELQNPPPIANSVHASTYSTLHDDGKVDSAAMCGSCHDIHSPAGGYIERTFSEWQDSAFSTPVGGQSCTFAGCHMTPPPEMVAVATGGPKRLYHPHNFAAVDVSLETSTAGDDGGGPAADGGLPGTTAVQNALNNDALQGAICVTKSSGIRVVLDTAGIGHHWPSGAVQDRRAWAEVIAYNDDGSVLYSSGVVPDGTPVTSISPTTDPDLWLLRDCMFNAQSQSVHDFWAATTTNGYELPALATFDASDPRFYQSHIVQYYPRPLEGTGTLTSMPARVTLRIRIQPVGLDVLNDLVSTGDLDPSVVSKMPTFDVSLQGPIGPGLATPGGLEWTAAAAAAGGVSYADPYQQNPTTCVASPGFRIGQPVAAQNAVACTAPVATP
jgi:Cytochrome c554 and c-prime